MISSLTLKGMTVLTPGTPQTTTMDESAYGFIMCGNTGFGDDDETKTFSYSSTANSPCSTIDLTGISNQFTGVFIFEDNLPTSAATPCIG